MPYRLQPGEPVGAELHRVVREELSAAAGALAEARAGTRDRAVHVARRGLKRIRSLLGVMGRDLEAEKIRLRDAGRKLSTLRDAAVMVDTLEAVVQQSADEVKPRELALVRRVLKAEARAVGGWVRTRALLQRVARLLERSAARSARWPLEAEGDALAGALDRRLGGMKKAMRQAKKRARPEDFHEWRKRAKHAWHLGQLAGAESEQLARLQSMLGDLHNLDVLMEWLRQRGYHETLRLAKQRRRELRAAVFELAG